jgi:hypothetical protein
MKLKKVTFCLSIVSVVLAAASWLDASRRFAATQDGKLAAKRLQNVHLQGQSLGQLLSDLSLRYDVPVGLEVALSKDELTDYRIDFNDGTLAELLKQLVVSRPEYSYEIQDDVVNFFPKENHRDPILAQLLTTHLSSFSVKAGTSCWNLEQDLMATSEIRRVIEANGIKTGKLNFTGAYIPQLGEHFVLKVSDLPLRSVLNKIVRESPNARNWIIQRNVINNTLFITVNAHNDSTATAEELPRRQDTACVTPLVALR